MAGHSKWANIKRHKAKQDAVKGKLYTKLIREVTVAAKLGGADSDSNPRLRAAMDKAFGANMSRDVVDRAIKRGAGGLDGADVEEVRYEGYGPGGVAIMVDCMTNNRNRTVGDVRHAFTKCGGNLGTDGSVSYLFSKKGHFIFAPGTNEDRIMELALDQNVDDVIIREDKSIEIITTPESFMGLKNALIAASFHPSEADITMIAGTQVSIEDKEIAEKLMRLVDMLEELDDVMIK